MHIEREAGSFVSNSSFTACETGIANGTSGQEVEFNNNQDPSSRASCDTSYASDWSRAGALG